MIPLLQFMYRSLQKSLNVPDSSGKAANEAEDDSFEKLKLEYSRLEAGQKALHEERDNLLEKVSNLEQVRYIYLL